ncbi:MAG: DUF3987 domain-containing protein [Anaerolineae bacterium]|nr:DUF3987 domain-containing protein [Anaerolineae bacterium]
MGRVTVRHAALSILGATTPVAMARTVKEDAWADGMMARLAMLCPDGLMPYDLGDGDPRAYPPPAGVAARLRALHEALPAPDAAQDGALQALAATITPDAHAAYSGNYARLHIQAVKVALNLACIDWADAGAPGRPQVTLALGAGAAHGRGLARLLPPAAGAVRHQPRRAARGPHRAPAGAPP